MHTLIPFAATGGPQCRQALTTLQLPHLERLLKYLVPRTTLERQTGSLTPLHERVAAQALGLSGQDGLIPWAAHDAQSRGLTGLHGDGGWAWITPCHWTVHADHVAMADPAHMALTPEDFETLWGAMEPYFAEDGITLFAQPLEHTARCWLAHGAVFKDLPTASLDRVAGQTVDPWMPRQTQARTVRRLQNEMQMLLYTHPLNDARAKYKLLSVNSFWVSGTGTPQTAAAVAPPAPLQINTALRSSALADDAAAWVAAWQALDDVFFSAAWQRVQSGEPLSITLCGEHRAITLQHRDTGLWRRVLRRFNGPQAVSLLTTL